MNRPTWMYLLLGAGAVLNGVSAVLSVMNSHSALAATNGFFAGMAFILIIVGWMVIDPLVDCIEKRIEHDEERQ